MIREIEVRPVAIIKTGDVEYVEWVEEEDADLFGIYLQQRDGTFRHYKDVPDKNGAMIAALLYAATNASDEVTWSVIYRTEEGDQEWTAEKAGSR